MDHRTSCASQVQGDGPPYRYDRVEAVYVRDDQQVPPRHPVYVRIYCWIALIYDTMNDRSYC
jgi:hypothetical protein